MQATFRHPVEYLVELRVSHLVKMSEVVVDHDVEVVVLEAFDFLMLCEDCVGDALLIGEGSLQVVTEMHLLLDLH